MRLTVYLPSPLRARLRQRFGQYTGGGSPAHHAIVRDGNVTFAANSEFKGVIIVIGDGTNTGSYTSTGNGALDGYVAASGDISIKGSISPTIFLKEITLLSNFLDVKLWSWRELYQ